MPEAPSDAWTRRRFGLATGGSIAALLGLASPEIAAKKNKKKKRRKKRCKRRGEGCKPGGKRKCCSALECGEVTERDVFVCCKGGGAPCTEDDECCSPFSCPFGTCLAI